MFKIEIISGSWLMRERITKARMIPRITFSFDVHSRFMRHPLLGIHHGNSSRLISLLRLQGWVQSRLHIPQACQNPSLPCCARSLSPLQRQRHPVVAVQCLLESYPHWPFLFASSLPLTSPRTIFFATMCAFLIFILNYFS